MTFRVEVTSYPSYRLRWKGGKLLYEVPPQASLTLSIYREGGPKVPLRVYLAVNDRWVGEDPAHDEGVLFDPAVKSSHEFRLESLSSYHPQGGETTIRIVGMRASFSKHWWQRLLTRFQQNIFVYELSVSS